MNNQKKILVTNAAGYTGMTVMQEIKISKPFVSSIALINSANSNGEQKDILAMDSSFSVVINKGTCQFLCDLFKDVDVVLLIPNADSTKVAAAKQIIECLLKSNVKKVVLLSSLGIDIDNPIFEEFKEIENCLAESGIDYCLVRSGLYAQSLLLWSESIKTGTLPLAIRNAKLNLIDLADVGTALIKIAAEMIDSEMHNEKIYSLTGPLSHSGEEIAEIMGEIMKRQVQFVSKSMSADSKIIDAKEVDYVNTMLENSYQECVSQVTEDYKKITQHDPCTFQTFVQKYQYELSGKSKLEQ